MMMNNIPLSLYIHIPWCVKKCPYCDFNSHQLKENIPEAAYVKQLIVDLDLSLDLVQNRPINSIFFGGGTPSLFSSDSIYTILQETQKRLEFANNIEITLEANPNSLDQNKFTGYRQAGVNRLSIGIQSFNQKHLTSLGRAHNKDEAILAAELAKKSNFDNFNLDLMFGLPEQTLEDALHDLTIAILQKPPHLSWYQLTIEPNTAFYKNPPVIPNDDKIFAIYEAGQQLLTHHGYQQYEVSAYAKENTYCQHNLHYWNFGDYLGIGAGAHGKLTNFNTQEIVRTTKQKQPKSYMQNVDQTIIKVSKEELPFEFMLNALRLQSGFHQDLFETRTGLSFSTIAHIIEQAEQKKLLTNTNNFIQPTQFGHMFLNDLVTLFL